MNENNVKILDAIAALKMNYVEGFILGSMHLATVEAFEGDTTSALHRIDAAITAAKYAENNTRLMSFFSAGNLTGEEVKAAYESMPDETPEQVFTILEYMRLGSNYTRVIQELQQYKELVQMF